MSSKVLIRYIYLAGSNKYCKKVGLTIDLCNNMVCGAVHHIAS